MGVRISGFGALSFSAVPAMCAPRKYGFIQSTVGDWKQTNSFASIKKFYWWRNDRLADLGKDSVAEIIPVLG